MEQHIAAEDAGSGKAAILQDVISVADIASEEAAPGTNIPDSPDVKAPQAPGNDLGEHDNTISQAQYDSGAFYWQPGPYYAPPIYASGWYYQDVQGHTQGPFTKQQLQLWRQHLPMDLMVWFIDQNGGSSHSLELAKVLGDGRLLESWRKTQQTEEGPQIVAPSATTYELQVSKASTTFSSWADAALAGLPPDDEAVQMAELAATAGRSLEDVLQFSYGAEASLKKRKRQDGSTEYTVIARHNPLTGRIEAETGDAEGGPDDALYRECISWCNPVEYEKYLQQKEKNKGQKGPPKNWKVLKERHQQIKQKLKKQADDWMRN